MPDGKVEERLSVRTVRDEEATIYIEGAEVVNPKPGDLIVSKDYGFNEWGNQHPVGHIEAAWLPALCAALLEGAHEVEVQDMGGDYRNRAVPDVPDDCAPGRYLLMPVDGGGR
jgi:hypothetical protein